MIDFVERLPWRLAALAGLLVGVASLLGGTDLWICLVRVGAAFAAFGLLGVGLRTLLQQGIKGDTSSPGTAKISTNSPHPGTHVDQTTPEMTVEDLQSAENKASSQANNGPNSS